jgi:D-alanine-D-alanine ligase
MTPIVLFGGASDERHVSVASGQNIAASLDAPLCWFWAPNGAVHDVAPDDLLRHENPFVADYVPTRPAIWPDIEQALDTLPVEDPVFVLALHGGEGEDGTLQRMMEKRGIAFTGSGSKASANALDKSRAKELVKARGVRVAEGTVVMPSEGSGRVVRAGRTPTGNGASLDVTNRRVVMKPLSGGSSRGLFFLDPRDAIPEVDVPYLIEEFIAGRELTIGVDEDLALPVIEIEVDPGRDFDYEGKYLGHGTREICPAVIPDAMRDEAQRIALVAHEAIGCEGYSRTDVIANADGVWFIELNTLPGLTKASLVPRELAVAGITMRDFLERQITLAVRRQSRAPRS